MLSERRAFSLHDQKSPTSATKSQKIQNDFGHAIVRQDLPILSSHSILTIAQRPVLPNSQCYFISQFVFCPRHFLLHFRRFRSCYRIPCITSLPSVNSGAHTTKSPTTPSLGEEIGRWQKQRLRYTSPSFSLQWVWSLPIGIMLTFVLACLSLGYTNKEFSEDEWWQAFSRCNDGKFDGFLVYIFVF